MSAHERFESMAAEWHAAGRPVTALLKGYDLIAVRCWTYSQGAKVDGVSATLRALVQASEAALPEDWLDAYLSEREFCRSCGERHRFENISLCTHCSRMFCYKCSSGLARSPNGNVACACGGEVVG